MKNWLQTSILMVAIGWVLPAALCAAEPGSPEAQVIAFNQAIGLRDTEAMQAALAEGSVQIQLRPAHPGMPAEPPLTGDLRKTWELVAAILFPSTESYLREIEVLQTFIDGEVATVWVRTTTRTQRKGIAEPMVLEFTEVYLLVQKRGAWQIAAIADNRAPDNISLSE